MKELYNKIEKWIQENPDLIKTIKNRETIESSGMCLTYNNDKDKDLIYWYEEVKDHKDLILGDVIVTIEDINKLVKPYFVLRNEKDMIEMLAGNFEEGDYHWEALDKALCRITAELFNYVYYTLGWKSREEYEKHLFNSMEFNDYIFDLYPPKNSIPTTKESKEN